MVIADDGKVREWNPAAKALFGYTREQAMGKELASLIIPPELRDQHRRGLAHYLRTGEGPVLGRWIEVQALRADGTRVPVELAITPHHGEEQTLFGLTLLRFGDDGLVADHRDYWAMQEGRRQPSPGWGR